MVNDIIIAYANNNNCYKANKPLVPMGIVVHSTGANNPFLRRYVDAPKDVGSNVYGNHWNNPQPDGRNVCVHAFIGKDINGDVRVAQILPYNIAPWGCGKGRKGSYNNTHIQFEICEDGLIDRSYFEKAFDVAIKYCAYLCKEFGLSIESIVSHSEAHKLGFASNHGDCDHWLRKFGKTMNDFRTEVKKELFKEIDKAKEVQRVCGFTDSTMQFLKGYEYGEGLIAKIYANLKGV